MMANRGGRGDVYHNSVIRCGFVAVSSATNAVDLAGSLTCSQGILIKRRFVKGRGPRLVHLRSRLRPSRNLPDLGGSDLKVD
jgi:hypothetical protein